MTPGHVTHRPDIQSVRGLAMLVVLAFHLWPDRLPGGFVGVDVFFVVSGFLIVGSLAHELRETGRIRVWTFWSRRARRLLPAALIVLAAATVGIVTLTAQSQWLDYLGQVVASATYWENWKLVLDSTDYMTAASGASPVQQFWTLSVEEQFYIAAPIVLLVLGLVSHSRSGLLIALGLATAASFAYAIWMAGTNPGVAFFDTGTRVWEFGVGALMTFVPAFRLGWLSWIPGLALVIAACFLLDSGAPFPSWTALLPTVGAALMLAGGRNLGRLGPIVGNRVSTWLGDVSYCAYLWHWPLIVLVPAAFGHPLSLIEKILVLATSLALAGQGPDALCRESGAAFDHNRPIPPSGRARMERRGDGRCGHWSGIADRPYLGSAR